MTWNYMNGWGTLCECNHRCGRPPRTWTAQHRSHNHGAAEWACRNGEAQPAALRGEVSCKGMWHKWHNMPKKFRVYDLHIFNILLYIIYYITSYTIYYLFIPEYEGCLLNAFTEHMKSIFHINIILWAIKFALNKQQQNTIQTFMAIVNLWVTQVGVPLS